MHYRIERLLETNITHTHGRIVIAHSQLTFIKSLDRKQMFFPKGHEENKLCRMRASEDVLMYIHNILVSICMRISAVIVQCVLAPPVLMFSLPLLNTITLKSSWL